MSLTQATTYLLSAIAAYSSISIFLTINYFRKPSSTSTAPPFLHVALFGALTIGGNALFLHGVYQRAAFSPPPSAYRLSLVALLQLTAHGLWYWTRRTVSPNLFTRAMSRDTPSILVTSGPYAYTRNPFYATYLMLYAAAAVLASRGVDYVLWGCFYMCYYLVSVSEERKFEGSELKGEYEGFRRSRVRFFVGEF